MFDVTGSIVISLSVVASQMMRGQPPQIFFLEPPLDAGIPCSQIENATDIVMSDPRTVGYDVTPGHTESANYVTLPLSCQPPLCDVTLPSPHNILRGSRGSR